MTVEQAKLTLANSETLKIWETNEAWSDSSSLGMQEVINAYTFLDPSFHVDLGCGSCLANLLTKASRIKKEFINSAEYYKFK
jgi:hypothetical protein